MDKVLLTIKKKFTAMCMASNIIFDVKGDLIMNDYIIFTDSTCDLDAEHIKELGVKTIPLNFTYEGKSYIDGAGLSYKDFYNLLREKKDITTSQINAGTFIKEFEPYLKEQKDILYIAFSSGLSGTYSSAKIAEADLQEKYPNRKIIVIDSLCASMGEGLLVHYAAEKKNNGASIEELAKWIENNKLNVCHWFTVDDLFHLKRGGRVSSVSALLGTMLGVKPILHVDDAGKLIPMEKVRGRKAALTALVEHMKKSAKVTPDDVVFISHVDSIDDANFIKDLVLKEFNVKEVRINYIGSVIGAHAGPGTIALFFMGQSR